MKTDYHCHVLPGLDDGAQNIEESVFLSRKLTEWGFTDAVCVVHSSYKYRHTPQEVLVAYSELYNALQTEHIDLTLHPTYEYRIVPQSWSEVRQNKWWLPWYGNHLLIEFPIRSREFFGELEPMEEVKRLVADGFNPVLAHPERYQYMGMDELVKLHDLGCEFQMNLGSIHGFYGEDVRHTAELIQSEGWYSYTGTDLHNKRYTDFYDAILLDNGEL